MKALQQHQKKADQETASLRAEVQQLRVSIDELNTRTFTTER